MHYGDMAEDVRAFLAHHGLAGASVMGHSMGGKTAMRLALEHGGDVGRLIVVDIAPVAYAHTHRPTVEAMCAVDLATVGRTPLQTRFELGHWVTALLPVFYLVSALQFFLGGAEGARVVHETDEKLGFREPCLADGRNSRSAVA